MARTFNVYNGDTLIKSGLSPLELQQLEPDTTYDLKISANEEGRESDKINIPAFNTSRVDILTDFTSKTSNDYMVGEWTTSEAFEQGSVYMAELDGTKPVSQSFGLFVGSKINNGELIGYFVPKNTGGNKYTMIFTYNKEIDINKVKLYQYPSGSTGTVTLNDFKIYKLKTSNNLLTKQSQAKLPVNTNTNNVFNGEVSTRWKLGKRYYIRIKGSKPSSQNFTVYIDAGITNKGNMSNIVGTNLYELTFTVSQWDINRDVDNIISIYQTPNGSGVGETQIDELLVLETNDAILPQSIEIIPNEINLKVGESSTSQFKLTPPNAENYTVTLLGWQGGIASNSTADPERGFTNKGVKVGNFTATVRSIADPSVETQVTVNVTE